MGNRLTKKERDIALSLYEGEYGLISGDTTPVIITKEGKISSYPSPRSYGVEYLKSKEEETLSVAMYKSELLKALQEREPNKANEENIIIVQSDTTNAILSTLARSTSGVTMDRVLRFIPELLYRQNKNLATISDGRAYRAINSTDTQLSLFVEAEEGENKTADISKTAIVKYNSREWAKFIYDKSNPQPTEVKLIEKVIDKLTQTKIYFPLGGGKYAYSPLIWRSNTGIIDTQDIEGDNYEYLRLHPLFTLALTECKKGIYADKEIIWHAPISVTAKLLTKSLEYRLLEKMELLYSYAKEAIRVADKKDKRVEHKENKEKLLQVVCVADIASIKKNKSRIIKDLYTAFNKMEQIGIIVEGSFKEDKNNYIWEWSPNYFKK